jgi:hypothetical protein
MSKARDIASAAPAPSTVSATELGYIDGVTSAIQTQINSKIGQSTAINPTIVDAKGDIIAASAADTPARLAVGANATVLTADSAEATGMKWAAPAGGGKVLQVVYANYSTATNASGSSNTDSGLTATITPTSNTSKILVLAQLNGCSKTGADIYMSAFLFKDSTSILQFAARYLEDGTSNLRRDGGVGCSYLDSPATTSATTYKVVFRNPEGVGTLTVQYLSANSTITLLEIAA